MRIMVKGGVWKNTEDEILKAAVMKYGKNQWARISSLLVRKSAKQCKARWYEWLDPSIKKTEWSREEEEKLLHLSKIMPNQWKTIAPLVGRTASQCLEHYEKLLDSAQNKGETYDPSEDARRLRPGEIDPNPEAKAARPDPIDMDEDEKEMLSEARARLANTKGKKAKRKAREKQLEEARRLAALQKRRELKAAGIEVGKPKRKIKGIDYNREIPFQKKPPPGFYEVDFSHEKELSKQSFKPLNLTDIDQKRKRETEEEEAQKDHDRKKKKKEKTNLPDVIMQINKLNDPDQVRTKTKLVLPAPVLNDADLEDIASGKLKATDAQHSLKTGLRSLPAPQNEYKITMPELPQEAQTENEEQLDADASDLLREQQRLAEEREQELLRLRSQALQRDLPRPFGLPPPYADYKSQNADPLLQQVDDMLRMEVVRLIAHEAVTYPFKQSKIASNNLEFDEFTEKEIKAAYVLIEEELKSFPEIAFEEIEKVSKEIDDDLIYVPSTKKYERVSKAQKKEKIKIEALNFEFDALKALMASEAAKAKKLEAKVDVYNKGYQNRANTLLKQIQETHSQLEQTHTELNAFRRLKEFEDKAMQTRVAELTKLFQIQEERERVNQQRYMDLITERENLRISVK